MSLLVGVAVAGLLIWAAAQIDADTRGGYWATIGILAAAGIVFSLARLARVRSGAPVQPSVPGFVLGFLPALIAAGWVMLANQPGDGWLESHIRDWSRDISIGGIVSDLGVYVPVVAFGLGTLLGFVLMRPAPVAVPSAALEEPDTAPTVVREPEPATREPVIEKREHLARDEEPERTTVGTGSGRR
jgi:hypothetical protein